MGDVALLSSSAAADGRFVVVGRDIDYESAVWTSGDGSRWERAALPPVEGIDLTFVGAGGPGFVLLGHDFAEDAIASVILLSENGRTWEPVSDPDLEGWALQQVGSAGNVLVGAATDADFEGQALFVSMDGRDWQSAPTPDALGRILDLVPNGNQLVALAVESTPDFRCARQLGLWQTADGQSWTRLATLPNSAGAECSNRVLLAIGGRGWAVVGDLEPGNLTSRAAAWHSTDGTSWEQASDPPSETTDIYAAPEGFIAVGHWYPAGCAIYEGDAWGQTWTSSDGRSWQLMPDEDWLHREVDLLRRLGRTLIGIGIDWTDTPNGAIWKADLAEVELGGGAPPPTPEPTPDGGCG